MDVDLILRDNAGLAAAGAAALDAENGTQGRLPQVHHRAVAQPAQAVGQADGSGGLALAGGRRRDAGNHHQLALLAVGSDGVEADLRLVVSEGNEMRLVQAKAVGYLGNRVHSAPMGYV